MPNQQLISKANQLLLSLLMGLGLALGLLGLLNNPFTRPVVARAANLSAVHNDCPDTLHQAVVGNDDRSAVMKATIDAITVTLSPVSHSRGPIPGLETCDTYAVYYRPLNEGTLASLKAFDLVILHPDFGLTSTQVAELQAAGVIVLVYISIGEEPSDTPKADSMGPVYYDPTTSCAGVPNRRCGNNGVSPYYLDEVISSTTVVTGHDGLPDDNPAWKSHYVDPASPLWRDRLKSCVTGVDGCNFFGTDYLINTLGADGLFLDTIDTASPWHVYSYTLESMAGFICAISDWYPDRYIVMNRGIFYADPMYGADVVRPCINGYS